MNAITIQPNKPVAIPPQADSDQHLIALWLHDKSVHSQRAYLADVEKFMTYVGKSLQAVMLSDLQQFMDSLVGSDNTRRRIVSSIKSLLPLGKSLAIYNSTWQRP